MRKIAEDTMTARERIEAVLKHKTPDRIPMFDLIQNIPLIEYCTGQKVTLENGLDLLCQTIGENLDITRGISPPVEEKIDVYDDGFVYKVEWWTTWLIERPFKTVNELKEYIRRNIEEIKARKPGEIWTFSGKSDVWGESAEDPKERYLKLQNRLGDTVLFPTESPVGLDTAYHRAGLQLFCYTYADDPELVSEWLEALCYNEVQRVHEVADSKLFPVALVYSDIAYKNATTFSPSFLRREFFPRLKRVVEAWHSHGIYVIFHSDGNLLEIIDDLIGTGIDGINPLEPLSGMDVSSVKSSYPDLITMGGIDSSQLLPYGRPGEVKMAVQKALSAGKESGRMIIGSSTEIHPACNLDNILIMWQTALKCGRY